MEKILKFDELSGIDSMCCVLGLKFPDTASEFQKAFLTLAHLSASARDFVLSGRDVPERIIELIVALDYIISHHRHEQR